MVACSGSFTKAANPASGCGSYPHGFKGLRPGLNAAGKPMSNSPLLYRAGAPPRFKYYGDGVLVPSCTGAIGAFSPQ